jgi:hypothetical protein
MNNLKTYEDFLNEAASIRVDLTPDLFSETSLWGIHKRVQDTGCATWRWNSNLLADLNPEGEIPGEMNVVMATVSIFSDGKGYAKVGITNSLKREPGSTMGMNYAFTVEDAEKNLKKVAKEAADFLMDAEHFKFINRSIVCNRRKLIVKPKGDFSEVYEKVIAAALKDKQ